MFVGASFGIVVDKESPCNCGLLYNFLNLTFDIVLMISYSCCEFHDEVANILTCALLQLT